MKHKTSYAKGVWAESLAALYLLCRGYRILARRYKTPVGEIDLIARKKDSLIIAEVKTRKTLDEALEAVGPKAQRRITRAALYFLSDHPAYAYDEIRFDVVVYLPPFRLLHLDNAWQAPS